MFLVRYDRGLFFVFCVCCIGSLCDVELLLVLVCSGLSCRRFDSMSTWNGSKAIVFTVAVLFVEFLYRNFISDFLFLVFGFGRGLLVAFPLFDSCCLFTLHRSLFFCCFFAVSSFFYSFFTFSAVYSPLFSIVCLITVLSSFVSGCR